MPGMNASERKRRGAYYTPDAVVRSLVRWATRSPRDRMLDPACGDGRFLMAHPNSVGVEQDPAASAVVHVRVPGCLIEGGDFFSWAANTQERFDCAAGNPPFIRYQRFTGPVRRAAMELCGRHGVHLSGLSSSWAPFLVATATLLKPGGRMAFVVPAEIGHAPYARPVLEYLAQHFGGVRVVAIRDRLFPGLSEDCWLLFAEGFGGRTDHFWLSALERFVFLSTPPEGGTRVGLREWRLWNHKLRPFFLSPQVRDLYQHAAERRDSYRLGEVARVGIGYVTGANSFFHLRPSEAERLNIPPGLLNVSVRKGTYLKGRAVTASTVDGWRKRDEPVLLLRLSGDMDLPAPVQSYLDSPAGRAARTSYKCRTRTPWYAVPDVTVPDGFLSYMSGSGPSLVANHAACVATNSVHVVKLRDSACMKTLIASWDTPLVRLSCEVEGHPLGGGLLKLEPREAARVLLPRALSMPEQDVELIEAAVTAMRRWRHHG